MKKWRFPSVFCNSPWRNGDFCRFFVILCGEIEIFISLGWVEDLYFLLYETDPSLQKRDILKCRGNFILSFALLRKTGLFSIKSFPRNFVDLGREEFLIFSFLC